MQHKLNFQKDEVLYFFSQKGANYIHSVYPMNIKEETFGLLNPNCCYRRLGTKKRTSFEWNEPAVYNGTFTDKKGCNYLIFNYDIYKGDYWCYAFSHLSDNKTFLIFTLKLQSCREVIIDMAV